ncbi:hypothetical protein THAOC_05358 [Thalassiosira oceanica]|uniref:MYND-type domain-containing protein n=1 Tax=Thalassiosira oceanica TaxID=159749 RepID=K0T5S8_THAOC|nr:hypothetical protein THAOC_05358 [Thalassiosira oceanica]|eukprot:EJK73040.1 hypothetical protein THAOC_05358 [Thalassiosira oceanica]
MSCQRSSPDILKLGDVGHREERSVVLLPVPPSSMAETFSLQPPSSFSRRERGGELTPPGTFFVSRSELVVSYGACGETSPSAAREKSFRSPSGNFSLPRRTRGLPYFVISQSTARGLVIAVSPFPVRAWRKACRAYRRNADAVRRLAWCPLTAPATPSARDKARRMKAGLHSLRVAGAGVLAKSEKEKTGAVRGRGHCQSAPPSPDRSEAGRRTPGYQVKLRSKALGRSETRKSTRYPHPQAERCPRWYRNSGRYVVRATLSYQSNAFFAHQQSQAFYLTMSCVPVVDDCDEVCANCGKCGSDIIKLKNCTACRLVKYCGVDCQRAHRKQHKKACKQRATELKDKQLYSQGQERQEGDFCSICTLPIPFRIEDHSVFEVCCMKRICIGCDYAAQKRGMLDCPFCRTPMPDNDADVLAMIQARVTKKDPVAINHLGHKYFFGRLGLQKDMQRAVELFTEAAELGSIEALFNLGVSYDRGMGVEQDKAKAVEFYEKAAMQGHVMSRYNLGILEAEKGNYDRAVKHLLISAKMGHENSIKAIKDMFVAGGAAKEQYTEALKGYQDALEEMKSHDRDEAKRLGY